MSRRSCQLLLTILATLSLLLCTTLCALGVEVHHPIPVGGLLVLPIAWPPAWAWHAYRQRQVIQRRIAAGQCLACGYDLRATPGRCPECGRVPLRPHSQSRDRTQSVCGRAGSGAASPWPLSSSRRI